MKALKLATTLLTLATGMALAEHPKVALPSSDIVATLATADNRLVYEVSHFGDTLQVTRIAGVPAPERHVHELWIITPHQRPVSLGLLENDPLVVDYPTPPAGSLFVVSIEPAGGSPTSEPTGPVILMTKLGNDA